MTPWWARAGLGLWHASSGISIAGMSRRADRTLDAAPASDPVRLGQYAGRQLGRDPRSALCHFRGHGARTLDARRDEAARSTFAARRFPAPLRVSLGGCSLALSRHFHRDAPGAPERARRRRAVARGARGGSLLPRGGQQQDRRAAPARG